MSLQGHHPIDIPFQQANGYQTDAPSAQHMYQSGYLPYQPEGYGNSVSLSQADHYPMPHGMGVVPHNISLEHHSGSGRKSEGKNASKSDKGGPGGDPHKAFDRKEKNRQAAQRSRKRKQDHMADLEATVARQALEIESLRTELIAANNRLARYELSQGQVNATAVDSLEPMVVVSDQTSALHHDSADTPAPS
eukprot:m.94770 g.94770  ORF g.94770 m.94770 type:complete len:192 (+) comp12295_c0_seq1:240-815(+)